MLTGHRCRLYPNAAQRVFFARSFGCVRWVYNEALAYCNAQREAGAKHPSAAALERRLPGLKAEHEWLAEADSQALKKSIQALDLAFRAFFRRVKAGQTPGYPRFKSKHDRARSFTATRATADPQARMVKIPKLGWVKCRGLRQFEGRIKRITVSRTASGHYYASVLVDDGQELPTPAPLGDLSDVLGIDLGCKSGTDGHQFAITSDGRVFTQPAHYKKRQKALARASRKLARKTKGSNNREKQRRKVARQHERVANQRRDYLHQLSHRLTRENQTVALETLNVRGMMAKTKPLPDGAGGYLPNGRAAKRGLARSLANVAMGEFLRQLEYKAARRGVNLIRADRWDPTSKTCSGCGSLNAELKLSDRHWRCGCGADLHRDVNAAINIARFAHARAVGGGSPELTSPDRETAA